MNNNLREEQLGGTYPQEQFRPMNQAEQDQEEMLDWRDCGRRFETVPRAGACRAGSLDAIWRHC